VVNFFRPSGIMNISHKSSFDFALQTPFICIDWFIS
jgi:hypothetical protein